MANDSFVKISIIIKSYHCNNSKVIDVVTRMCLTALTRIRKALENRTNMEDDRVAILEAQLSQAKLIAEESDKKYEEVNMTPCFRLPLLAKGLIWRHELVILACKILLRE